MFQPVSLVMERMKGHGMESVAQVAALLALDPAAYYAEMKQIARQVREHYRVAPRPIGIEELGKIYRAQRIRLTFWSGKVRSLRGAYFNDELGVDVMVMKELSEDALAFTMAHELKHHFVDSDLKPSAERILHQLNPVEIGADLFAGELLYPEKDFEADLRRLQEKTRACPVGVLLLLKERTRTTLPYRVFRERAVSMGLASAGEFRTSSWRRLENANW